MLDHEKSRYVEVEMFIPREGPGSRDIFVVEIHFIVTMMKYVCVEPGECRTRRVLNVRPREE